MKKPETSSLNVILIGFFMLFANELPAQATFRFDQKTKAIVTKDSKWKVGQDLKVIIENYQCTNLKYVITYKGDESVNEEGLSLFRSAAGDAKMNGATEAICPPLTYLSIPIVNKDYSLITIEEFDGDQSTDKQTYTFRNQGGMKFDVSTGFFISGLKDDAYIIVSDTLIPTQGVIAAEKTGDIRVGIGVLAHLHSRLPRSVINVGLAGGFELDNDAKVGYLAGVSIFIGYDQKFVLSGGWVFGKKAKISNAYYEGQEVDFSLSVVPMVDVWDRGYFGSLTYNF